MKQSTNPNSSAVAPLHFEVLENSPGASLPALATANDVREAVRVLKRKPEGIHAVQASDLFGKRLFNPGKVSAYEYWGIVFKDGNRLKLSPLGWEFASRLTSEVELYRAIIKFTKPYETALVWTYENKLDVVTHFDIGAFWAEQYPDVPEAISEDDLESYAASFFHICHAAEIGMLTVGRKGQPTRLHIYSDELRAHLDKSGHHEDPRRFHVARDGNLRDTQRQLLATRASSFAHRVFISHNDNLEVMSNIQEVLELADLEPAVVNRISDAPNPVSQQAFEAMRRCDAGIIVITERDCRKDHAGRVVVDQNVSVEVGAAFTHFDRRVVLLLEKSKVPLPSNLQGVLSCEFEGQRLLWDTAVQLVKIVRSFKQELAEKPGPET